MLDSTKLADLKKISDALLLQVRSNPRLRFGIMAIAAILLMYVFLVLGDIQSGQETELERLSAQLQKIEQVARQKNWSLRVQEAEQSLDKIERRLGIAENKGVAQASFQSWLDTLAAETGLEDYRIRVDSAQDEARREGLWAVAGQVEARFSAGQLEALLLSLAKSSPSAVTERLDISTTGREPRFTLVLRAWYRAGKPGEKP